MRRNLEFWLLLASCLGWLLVAAFMLGDLSVQAATPTPEPVPPCIHVATADAIRVYLCEDYGLFVNNLGFMAFEP